MSKSGIECRLLQLLIDKYSRLSRLVLVKFSDLLFGSGFVSDKALMNASFGQFLIINFRREGQYSRAGKLDNSIQFSISNTCKEVKGTPLEIGIDVTIGQFHTDNSCREEKCSSPLGRHDNPSQSPIFNVRREERSCVTGMTVRLPQPIMFNA